MLATVGFIHISYVLIHDGAALYELSKQTSKQIHRCLVSIFIAAIDIDDADSLRFKCLLKMVDNEGSGRVHMLAM